MRELIVTENVTLDGVADTMDQWFSSSADDSTQAANQKHQREADAVLLGRVTYQEFASYWPLQTDDKTGVTDYLNRTHKYVVSSSLDTADWENTTILGGPVAQEVAALKREPGKAIVATGSLTLVQALMDAQLVDAVRLFVYPVILGRGRRLFGQGSMRMLQLVESETFSSGIVLLTYRVLQADHARSESAS